MQLKYGKILRFLQYSTNVLVVHPRMIVSDFIKDHQKVWDVKMLKNFVIQEDILLIHVLLELHKEWSIHS